MTPSDIADWLDNHSLNSGEPETAYCKAAATIRELEAGRAKWEADDGLDGSVVHAVREVLNRANVPTMSFIDDHVALLVHQRDAAEAKLKIATEALEDISKGNRGQFESGDHMAFDKLMCADQALDRIKGV